MSYQHTVRIVNILENDLKRKSAFLIIYYVVFLLITSVPLKIKLKKKDMTIDASHAKNIRLTP